MVAYVGGDSAAFERLFARMAPKIHGFFMRSLREVSVADDLLQITFLKIHRARRQYSSGLPVKPWLFAIAARVRFDELRRRYRLPESADEESLTHAERMHVESAGQETSAETSDRIEAVRAALARLPETQRAVVHLHRYEGMTFGEIANVLGISEGAAKLRAFRAYEELRQELAVAVASEVVGAKESIR